MDRSGRTYEEYRQLYWDEKASRKKLQAQLEGATKQHQADVEELHERLLTIDLERGKRTELQAQVDGDSLIAEIKAQKISTDSTIKDQKRCITQLESQLDTYKSIIEEWRLRAEKAEAQLDEVRELPEKWSHGLVTPLDGSYWGAIDMCSDGIKSIIGDKSE